MQRSIVLASAILLSLMVAVFVKAQEPRPLTVSLPEFSLQSLNSLTATSFDIGAERVRELIFDTLVIRDRHLDHVAHLASRMEVLNDGRTLIFHLRQNVNFHNGKKLQAADVVYSLNEMLRSRGFKAGALFETVEGKSEPLLTDIRASDELTVNITMSRSGVKERVMSILASIPIIPFGSIEQIETAPIGTGPFCLQEVDLKTGMVDLVANKDYWDGPPTIAGVRLKSFNTPASRIDGLSNGRLDVAIESGPLAPLLSESVGKLHNVHTHHFPGLNIWYLGINTTSDQLKDVRVRKAIAFAIDRQKIVDIVAAGRGMVAHSILPPQSSAYSEGVRYETNLAEARRLLKEAGYDGKRISIKFIQGNPHTFMLAKAIREMLVSAGISAELDLMDPAMLRAQLLNGDFELNIGIWINGNQDPLFLRDLFSTSGIPSASVSCCNRSRFSDAKVDVTIEQAARTDDAAKKRELYKKAWDLISGKMPLMPLYHPAIVVVANKRIGNIDPSPTGDWRFIKDLRLIEIRKQAGTSRPNPAS